MRRSEGTFYDFLTLVNVPILLQMILEREKLLYAGSTNLYIL